MARVVVPGSSANLGAGFDALALALDVYIEADARPRRGKDRVILSGRHVTGLPKDDTNLVWRAFHRTFKTAREMAPDSELLVRNEIPLGRGLGSSGAAAVAGVALASAVGGLHLTPPQILSLAAEIEGHPDNVAASVFGGLAIVAKKRDEGMEAISLPWPKEVGVVMAIPDLQLPTQQARAVLPDKYSRADAVFNLQRAALFVAAAASKNTKAFSTALEDCWHQSYRSKLVPGLAEALGLKRPGLLGIALSGAGPSLIAFVTDPAPASAALSEIYSCLKIRCEVLSLKVAPQGVQSPDSPPRKTP